MKLLAAEEGFASVAEYKSALLAAATAADRTASRLLGGS